MTATTRWRLYSALSTEAIYVYVYDESAPDQAVRLPVLGLSSEHHQTLAGMRRGDVVPEAVMADLLRRARPDSAAPIAP